MEKKVITLIYSSLLILLIFCSVTIYSWVRSGVVTTSFQKELIEDASLQVKDARYPYLEVDLEDSYLKNSDTIGWIQVTGTNINYPVVQTTDNEYYLSHSFSRSESVAGWVYMDYRNRLSDHRLILYAHNRLDGTMFGSLIDVIDNYQNSYLYFNTLEEAMTFQIVSIYVISEEEFLNTTEVTSTFLEDVTRKNQISSSVELSKDDTILTLYTCYGYGRERLIVNAKKIQSIPTSL